ncbi:MAG: class I SAM-dependent methyltransferase, partial [Candidatus Woesearchaeota archaeon]
MAEYDFVADEYEAWTKGPLRKYAWQETVKRNIGSLKGKNVLDLACGTGVSTEILYSLDAEKITGLDISEEELKIARNKRIPCAKFILGDITEFDSMKLGKFDVVVALFLL